jgi:hypothetical protein
MSRRFPPALTTALVLGLAPLANAGTAGCDDLRGGEITPQVDWQTQVKPILNIELGGRCSSCHAPGATPDLSDAGTDAIYKIIGSYVIPGQPRISGLFDKINCETPFAGARMPFLGVPLTLDQQALIYDWIAQGARGEPGAPIYRSFLFRDGAESRRWY